MKKVKVVWFRGEPDLRARADSGILELDQRELIIEGEETRRFSFASMTDINLSRVNSLGTVVRISLQDDSVSVMIPRVNIRGYFVVVNLLATRRLFRSLREAWKSG